MPWPDADTNMARTCLPAARTSSAASGSIFPIPADTVTVPIARTTKAGSGCEKRLPCKYYLITFTLPEQLRDRAWKHQKTAYALMFLAVQDLLKSFTHNDKKLGGSPGFTAILHTQSRTLDYHPHIHVVMPGASVNLKTGLWKEKSDKYLFSHKALAKVFRAKLLQSLVENDLPVPHDCPKKWVVDCKDAGNGEKVLIYLGRYLYRGVIREKDILHCVITPMNQDQNSRYLERTALVSSLGGKNKGSRHFGLRSRP